MKKIEKTQRMRERILTGAIQEIARFGYHGFRINDLCQKHGFSKGSLYHLFPSKHDLYRACVEQSFAKVLEVLERTSGPVPSLAEYLHGRLEFYRNYPDHAQVFLSALLVDESRNDAQIAAYRNSFDDFNRRVAERLIQDYELKPGVSESEALDYLDFVQQLFRSFYLSQQKDRSLVESQAYEEHLQEMLHKMVFGIVHPKQTKE